MGKLEEIDPTMRNILWWETVLAAQREGAADVRSQSTDAYDQSATKLPPAGE
jgi:hypothetical protein